MLKYGTGLRLFKGIHTLEDTRNRIETLVDKLKVSNLLLDTEDNAAFGMHDLIWNVAKEITSMQHHLLVLQRAGGTVLEEWPKMDGLRMLTMWDLDVDKFPLEPTCPNLQLLGCWNLNPNSVVQIPNTFFNEMKGLKVLDFTKMCLPSLPTSLDCLTNLRTLCLDECKLGGDISLIVEVKTLEVLSLMKSNIEVLPKEITGLTRLRLLDLKGSSALQVIPAGVIANLTRLENLCMKNSFTQWEKEGKSNACVAELQLLSHLTYLDTQIPHVHLLPKDTTFFDKLERYRIFIGDSWSWRGKFETNKTLKLDGIDLQLADAGINKLLKRSEDLSLSRFRGGGGGGSNYALSRLDGEGFLKLKHLTVENCEEMLYVVNSLELSHDSRYSAFPVLEKLVLIGLSNLQQVCHGPFPAGSFGCLRKIEVKECQSLKFLFSMTMAKGLSALERIKVTECESMENVVAQGSQQELIEEEADDDDDDDGLSLFPKLRKLRLRSLPKFHGFCFNGMPRLQQADLDSASPVLFDARVTFPSLEVLSISRLNHVKRIWDIQVRPHSFSNLKYVLVSSCEELLNVFPPCMMRWLQRLQTLDVMDCDSLEEVFDTEGGGIINNANEEVAATITQLIELSCGHLPKMKQIWNEGLTHILSFRNLKSVYVLDCPGLKSLFPAYLVLRDLVQLQELHVEACGIEEIVVEDKRKLMMVKTSPMMFEFPKLISLELSRLHQLKNFYAGPHLSRWPSLKELTVDACGQAINLFGSATTAEEDDEGITSNIATTRQLLFSVRPDAFRCLEKLTLKSNDHITDRLWQEQFRVDFRGLRGLNVEKYQHISVVIPPFMLQRLRNLDKLSVSKCDSVKEIFQLEGVLDVKNQSPWLGCLKKIYLDNLPELLHIWKGNSEESAILELKSLENLQISDCESLKFLFPRLVSFQNLQSLIVWSCGSLRSLMSASTAKTLVKLETLEIGKSGKMEELIDSNGGDEKTLDENEIVFPKLKELKFRVLPNLTSFSLGRDYIFFPIFGSTEGNRMSKDENFLYKECSCTNAQKHKSYKK